jgi:hypothetical protein
MVINTILIFYIRTPTPNPSVKLMPTAGRQSRATGTVYIFGGSGLASCRWHQLTSNVETGK